MVVIFSASALSMQHRNGPLPLSSAFVRRRGTDYRRRVLRPHFSSRHKLSKTGQLKTAIENARSSVGQRASGISEVAWRLSGMDVGWRDLRRTRQELPPAKASPSLIPLWHCHWYRVPRSRTCDLRHPCKEALKTGVARDWPATPEQANG